MKRSIKKACISLLLMTSFNLTYANVNYLIHYDSKGEYSTNTYSATIFGKGITKVKNNVYIFSYNIANETLYKEKNIRSVRYGTSIIDLKNNKIGHCSSGWYASGDVPMPWIFDGGDCSPSEIIGDKKSRDGGLFYPEDPIFRDLLKKIINNKCDVKNAVGGIVDCSN